MSNRSVQQSNVSSFLRCFYYCQKSCFPFINDENCNIVLFKLLCEGKESSLHALQEHFKNIESQWLPKHQLDAAAKLPSCICILFRQSFFLANTDAFTFEISLFLPSVVNLPLLWYIINY